MTWIVQPEVVDDVLSNPSPVLFFGVAFFIAILGMIMFGTLFMAIRRTQGTKTVSSKLPQEKTNTTEISGPELLSNLQSATASLQAQDRGSPGYNQQLQSIRSLLGEAAQRYPSSRAKIQGWSQQLQQSGGEEGQTLLVLTEIHGWTRQLLAGLG